MRDLVMPRFNDALAPPRMQTSLDGVNNIGTVLGSAAVTTLSDIANTYTQAQQTKSQAMAAGQAMIDLGETAAGTAYLRTAEQIKPNYFATSAGSGRSGGVSNIQGGMMDDVLKMLQKQVDQKNALALIQAKEDSQSRLMGTEFSYDLAGKGVGHMNQLGLIDEYTEKDRLQYTYDMDIEDNRQTGRTALATFVSQLESAKSPIEAQTMLGTGLYKGDISIKPSAEAQQAYSAYLNIKNPTMQDTLRLAPYLDNTSYVDQSGSRSSGSDGPSDGLLAPDAPTSDEVVKGYFQ